MLKPVYDSVAPFVVPSAWVSTGFRSIDLLCGRGLPKGRIVQVFGVSQGRKSTFSVIAMARAQAQGMMPVMYDTEGGFLDQIAINEGMAFDPPEFEREANQYGYFGGTLIKTQKILRPGFLFDDDEDTMEALFQEIRRVCFVCARSGVQPFIVVDSATALSTKSEQMKGMMGQTMMDHAKTIRKAYRLLRQPLRACKGILVIIDHRKPTGDAGVGSATQFFASVRLSTELMQDVYSDADQMVLEDLIKHPEKRKGIKSPSPRGFLAAMHTEKVRGSARTTALWGYDYENGVDDVTDTFWAGLHCGIIVQGKAGYYEVPNLPGKAGKKFQGQAKWESFYQDNVMSRLDWFDAEIDGYYQRKWDALCERGGMDAASTVHKYLEAQKRDAELIDSLIESDTDEDE